MNTSKNNSKTNNRANLVEAIKDIGSSTAQSLSNDLVKETSNDFIRELLGIKKAPKRSGDLIPGESLEFSEVFSGKANETEKYKKQIILERNISQETSAYSEKRTNELRMQLKTIQEEVIKLAGSTQNLAKETQIAAMQVVVEPGEYHLTFFEKILEFIRSFRKKIDNASMWMNSSNKRAEKKNYWSTYKKKGSSFLLSPDHYLQRSAG